MSGEFATVYGNYFHEALRSAVTDYANGREHLTRLWGDVFFDLLGIAHTVAYVEARDNLPSELIEISRKSIIEIRSDLEKIENYLGLFEKATERYKGVLYFGE